MLGDVQLDGLTNPGSLGVARDVWRTGAWGHWFEGSGSTKLGGASRIALASLHSGSSNERGYDHSFLKGTP